MLSKICLLIIPISDFVGFISLHVGLFMKSGLWSFNVMNASLLAETSTRSFEFEVLGDFFLDDGNRIRNVFVRI